jgi:putative membrane protein
MFMMVFFWVGLILLGVLVVRAVFGNGTPADRHDEDAPSAQDILARRYARGEIDKAEYDRMRGDLM